MTVVMVSGSLVVVILVYCGVAIARNAQLNQRVKRSSWTIVLVIIGALAKMGFTLAQH